MKYIVEIKHEAREEVAESFKYYESVQRGLGLKFLDCVEITLTSISKHPELFAKKHQNFRIALIKPFPYLVIFEVNKSSVIVYQIINAKKHPSKRYK